MARWMSMSLTHLPPLHRLKLILYLQALGKHQAVGKPPRAPRIQADSADSEDSTGTEFDATEAKCGPGALQSNTLSARDHRKKA